MILLNPKGKVNLHTHTAYCDGNDTPEALVKKAIELGMEAIGFSGHEHSYFDESYCMSIADTEKYRSEILELREKYKGKIKIYLGIERDYFGEGSDYPYDYVIGSLHCVLKDGEYLYVDYTEEILVDAVNKHFDGDYMALVKCYYDTIVDVVEKTGADIIGHFDQLTKFNEGNKYFDEESAEYKEIAISALRKVAAHRPIFEINTGAMAKGYRTSPFPSRFLVDEIIRLGCPIILSSDCHSAEKLLYKFDEIKEQLGD